MPFHGSNFTAALSVRARILLLASIAALVVTSFDAHAAPAAAQSAGGSQQLAPGDSAEVGASQQRREAYEARRAYPYGGGYAYGPQPYVTQPQVYHQRRVYPQQPYAYRGGPRAYDDPVIQRLNQQTPGVINYGPPRIGW